jgi:hypothetical protein
MAETFQRYEGGRLFTDGDLAVLSERYIAGEPIDELAKSIGRSGRTLNRLFRDIGAPERPRGPQPRGK